MNSIVSPPAPTTPEVSTPRLLLVRSEGTKTPLSGPDATPQTVGAGPRCSIRLDGPGLRPLHCVITPTDDGIVIRRWASETRLNGLEFTEARLAAGDIVRVGSIDLRVVELLPIPPEPTFETPPAVAEPETPVPASALDTPDSAVSVNAGTQPENVVEDSATFKDRAEENLASANELLAQATAETTASAVPDPVQPEATLEQEPEVEGEIASVPEAMPEAADPAIPSHLLQPWGGGESKQLVPNRDTATSAVPLNAFDSPASEITEAPTPTPSTPLDDEWAVSPMDPAESVAEEAAAVEPAVALSNEWAVEAEVPLSDEPPTSLDKQDSVAIETDQATVESFAQSTGFESVATREPATTRGRSYEVRLAANRCRVRSLVATLRAEREQVTLWQAAVEERDSALLAAHEQIAEASAAADSNEATRQELVAANDRIATLEAERSEALEAAAAATVRVEELERQLAVQSAPEVEPLAEVIPEAAEAASEAETSSCSAVEATAEEQPVPVSETPEAVSPLWAEAEAEYAPPTEEVTVAPVASDAADEGPAHESYPPAAATEEPVAEELWGIEQLAAVEESSVTDQADPTPAPGEAHADPVEEQASVPEDTPAESDWTEAAPSEAIVESLSLEEAAPTADAEPTPFVNEPQVDPEQPVVALKDPFAKPEEDSADQPHEAPESFIEKYAQLMPDDDEPVDAPTPIAEPAPVAAELTPSEQDEDEESIDDYMRKLMGRVRGDAPAAPAEEPQAEIAEPAMPEENPQPAAPPKPAEPVTPIRDLSELKRTPTREINTDMGALRKLANQSARHAIDVAATRQSREQATLRLTASAVAIGCGALASITAISPFDLQFAGGLAGVAGGSWLGLRTLRACQAAARQDELEATAAGDSFG